MARQRIVQICPQCLGTKKIEQTVPGTEENPGTETTLVDCTQCEGTGKILWGFLKVEQEPDE